MDHVTHFDRQRLTRRLTARGLATVEFALVAPLLCLLLLGTAELGRAFFDYMILSHAVRDSARYVSSNALNGTTGVVSLTANTIATAQDLVVFDNPAGTGAPRLPGLAAGQVVVSAPGDNNVQVVASYPYQPIIGTALPLFGLGADQPTQFVMVVSVIMRAIS